MDKKKLSIFQIVCAILIGLLLIAVIVQIFIIVNLQNKTQELEKKLADLPKEESIENSQNFCYDVVVDEVGNSSTIYKV